ncbi:hypothetical protein V502_05209 [Pseudogymnoascus sp. VKM F-4520 (FW-2644)]|nr:hypothetical protein V502_05209 [Pseudogymnoascus sp. VKM F-4520 (FW-2644)]
MSTPEDPEPLYTVIVRVPFPRDNFVDPPPVAWDASKDRSLWKILSKTPKNSEMNWNTLAESYDVSLSFLLQQAAYLYDRQFSQVRAQLRKVGASKNSVPSPILGTESTGGEAMVRTVSGGSQQQTPSTLSIRRDSPAPNADGGGGQQPTGRAGAPQISRTSSSNTTTQIQSRHTIIPSSPHTAKAQLHGRSMSPLSRARRPSNTINTAYPHVSSRPTPLSPTSVLESSSEESSSDSDLPVQSRMLRRPPRRLHHSEDGDDDEDSPTFLPFTNTTKAPAAYNPGPTAAREDAIDVSHRKKPSEAILRSHTSDSSASSTAQNHPPSHRDPKQVRGLAGASPIPGRRTAELAGRSPVSKGKEQGMGRESDGTPSMGSSFSDLDDASVTQSALEEALLSNMQHGGMASKMSTFSHAFRRPGFYCLTASIQNSQSNTHNPTLTIQHSQSNTHSRQSRKKPVQSTSLTNPCRLFVSKLARAKLCSTLAMAQSPSTLTRLSEAFVISCGTITLDPVERKVLLIRWNKNGEIFLPKGRKNIGEGLEDATVRETYEETGFRVTILPLPIPTLATPGTAVGQANELNTEPIAFSQRLTDNNTLKLIFWFSARGDSTATPESGTQEEGEDFDPIWVDLDSVIETLTFADDRRIAERLISLMPSCFAA